MFWRSKQPKKRPTSRRSKSQRHGAAHLFRIEHLESRHMLSVVNVIVTPLGAPFTGNTLTLQGDSQGDSVMLQSIPGVVGGYTITGTGSNPTLLSFNGGATTNNPLTVNNITGDISVTLGSGDTKFDFEGPGGTAQSSAPANVVVTNSTGDDADIFNNVLINGNLTVNKAVGASGNSSLTITSSTIVGNTTADNTGGGTGGGVSTTTIDSSALEGNVALLNRNGYATVQVTSNNSATTFGSGNRGLNNLTITNGDGGSLTTFAGNATNNTIVYGQLLLTNGNTVPGEIELASFNSTTVLGGTTIVNGNSDTKVTSTNSNLGMQLASPPGAPVPAPVTITNGLGYDTLAVTGSTMPWGLNVSDDNAAVPLATGNVGSSTTITTSSIGTRIGGPNLGVPALAGDALRIVGDNGPDLISVSTSTIGGTLDLTRMGSGNNSITLDSNTIGAVDVATAVGTSGNNYLKIAGGVIQSSLVVNFNNNGNNEFDLRNGTSQINGSTVPVLPSLLTGTITIFGGPGTNTFRYDVGIAVPPLQGFTYISSP